MLLETERKVETEGAEVTLGGREFRTSEQKREKALSPWVIAKKGELKGRGAEQPGHSDGEYRREEERKGRAEQRSLSRVGAALITAQHSTSQHSTASITAPT
jgi:hypothetical protein